jgi:hypothetical protein
MIRMLVIGYSFGIRSERRLCDEVHLKLAYRWFCRLSLNEPVPDHSTFSKNRHGRFRQSDLFRRSEHPDQVKHQKAPEQLPAKAPFLQVRELTRLRPRSVDQLFSSSCCNRCAGCRYEQRRKNLDQCCGL